MRVILDSRRASGGGGGIRNGQALTVLNSLVLPQRTQKPESFEIKIGPVIYMGG